MRGVVTLVLEPYAVNDSLLNWAPGIFVCARQR